MSKFKRSAAASNHQFSMIPSANIPRSTFSRSHGYKSTFNSGLLIPFYVDEALPGDTFNVQVSTFVRLATPLFPIMDNLYLDVFFFAVPNRLVWDNWEKFCGSQVNPGDSTDYVVPQIPLYGGPQSVPGADRDPATIGSLGDYFGLPAGSTFAAASGGTPITSLPTVSALPFRAYFLIWNDWFRDENLQPTFAFPTDDGPDYNVATATYKYSCRPLWRGKRHDYFSSCLPWPQKGPGVELPLGTTAPVKAYGGSSSWAVDPLIRLNNLSGTPSPYPVDPSLSAVDGGLFGGPIYPPGTGPSVFTVYDNAASASRLAYYDPGGTLYADLSAASAATINSLRLAFQIQKLYERDARGGTRYTEILRSHFGVISPDARLQRPEYLGGGSTPFIVNPVAQTSATGETGSLTPQGNLAAYGIASSSGKGFVKSFVEHSIIIGLVSVRADVTYQGGLNRMWSRKTRWDYYWPALAHIGEQAVLNQELFMESNPASGTIVSSNLGVFGYQERWAEYRYYPSLITGNFRSTSVNGAGLSYGPDVGNSLDPWHLALPYGGSVSVAPPMLDEDYITDSPPIDRVLAVPTASARGPDQFLFDSHFAIRVARPMPVYSVPGLIDHF